MARMNLCHEWRFRICVRRRQRPDTDISVNLETVEDSCHQGVSIVLLEHRPIKLNRLTDVEAPMIKFIYPDGSCCYRALHSAHAVYRNEEGKLIARAERADRTGMYEFEIRGFELLEPGKIYE